MKIPRSNFSGKSLLFVTFFLFMLNHRAPATDFFYYDTIKEVFAGGRTWTVHVWQEKFKDEVYEAILLVPADIPLVTHRVSMTEAKGFFPVEFYETPAKQKKHSLSIPVNTVSVLEPNFSTRLIAKDLSAISDKGVTGMGKAELEQLLSPYLRART